MALRKSKEEKEETKAVKQFIKGKESQRKTNDVILDQTVASLTDGFKRSNAAFNNAMNTQTESFKSTSKNLVKHTSNFIKDTGQKINEHSEYEKSLLKHKIKSLKDKVKEVEAESAKDIKAAKEKFEKLADNRIEEIKNESTKRIDDYESESKKQIDNIKSRYTEMTINLKAQHDIDKDRMDKSKIYFESEMSRYESENILLGRMIKTMMGATSKIVSHSNELTKIAARISGPDKDAFAELNNIYRKNKSRVRLNGPEEKSANKRIGLKTVEEI